MAGATIPAEVPGVGTPVIDPNGYINLVWHDFFFTLLCRTGGSEGRVPVTSVSGGLPIVSTGGVDPIITINAATPGSSGSMSGADKAKLDSVTSGAAVAAVTAAAPITSSGGASPVIGITAATTIADGSMSAADKVKLNGIGAGATVTGVSGTAPIVSSGGAAPAISITNATTVADGAMSAADKVKLNGIGTGATVTGVTGTAPIVSSGGAAPAISIAAATSGAAGSMSAADKAKLDTIPGSISCFSAFQNAAQAIPANTQTIITSYTKLFDDLSELSTGTSVFTPAVSGTYIFTAGVTGGQVTATRRLISIFVNGAQKCTLSDNSATNGQAVAVGTSPPMRLVAGDAVTFVHFTGIADTTFPGQNTVFFGGHRIK